MRPTATWRCLTPGSGLERVAASAGEGFDLDRGDDRNSPPARALQADRKVLRHRHINHTGKGGAAVRVRGCDRPWGVYQHDATDPAAADPGPEAL